MVREFRRRSGVRFAVARALSLAAVVGITVLVPASSAAAETVVTRFPFTTTLFNPCNQDLVLINGELQVETHITAQDNHLLFEVAQWSHDIDAASVFTQDRYSYTEESGSVLNAQLPDGSYRSQAHSVIHLVHHGETPQVTDDDLFVHVQFTVRYDARTGEVTVVHDRFDAECR